ncbi:MAG: dTDP-glucose 4,6-dehydratase [Magnetococcales bacterium]|nr:dTDP-glucose 4,6-dehydratase [Magnetococcales bacterium]
MKTILLTGGAGFIGSNLVRNLLESGHTIINLDLLTYAGSLENLKGVPSNSQYRFVHGSIGDKDLVDSLLKEHQPDAIVNVAAETHVDRSIDDPDIFIDTNIVGLHTLLRLARYYWSGLQGDKKSGFRFLQVSTDEVYGSVMTGLSKEDDPFRANSPYAAAKASGDLLVRSYHKTYGLPTLITNGSNTYGPHQFPEKLIPLTILKAIAGEALPIYGDGKNVRDWLFVEDHCRGIAHTLMAGEPGRNYNIGGSDERPNIEVVQKLCAVLDTLTPRADGAKYQDQITYVADRPGHDFRYALDTTLAQSLGWRTQVEFSEGLETTVSWYLNNQPWCKAVAENIDPLSRIGLATK